VSTDLVALTGDRPDIVAVVEGLAPRLKMAVGAQPDGCRLYDESGRLVMIAAEPLLVAVPGEVERLLGGQVSVAPPVWWTDIRAAADLPDAHQAARACAEELVARHGGTVWSGAGR